MENNTRHTASSAEPRNWEASNSLRNYQNHSAEHDYTNTVTKLEELNSKIGRRYSFDDNGGSYQGL